MTDFLLLEEIHKMIKGTEKPRVMHRKGICANGYFRPFMSLSEFTASDIFRGVDVVTPVTVRFSSMLGDRGTADSRRNIKCMSVKFHGENTEYDMICQSIPVFFINDANKFSELARALHVNENFDDINKEELWKFMIRNPEASNCILRMYSYEGLTDSYIYGKWNSVNSVIWKNINEKEYYVRYKWVPVTKNVHTFCNNNKKNTRISAEFMAGFEPEKAGEELKNSILNGEFPQFHLFIQIAEHEPESLPTLIWEDGYTEIEGGVLKITDLEDDDYSFDPGSSIVGIHPKTDEFTQVMNFAHKLGRAERMACI